MDRAFRVLHCKKAAAQTGSSKAARLAWPAWKALSPADRATILHRWHDCILENTDDLAKIMTLEQGKPLAEAKGEIANALGYITWFAEEARRAYINNIKTAV